MSVENEARASAVGEARPSSRVGGLGTSKGLYSSMELFSELRLKLATTSQSLPPCASCLTPSLRSVPRFWGLCANLPGPRRLALCRRQMADYGEQTRNGDNRQLERRTRTKALEEPYSAHQHRRPTLASLVRMASRPHRCPSLADPRMDGACPGLRRGADPCNSQSQM